MPKNRRRAIHCDLIEPSKTSPGYYKYQITIREKDGSEHIVPAYGKDMQDAIERLLWNERVESITEKKFTMPVFVTLGLSLIITSGTLSALKNEPLWIVGGMVTVIVLALGINRIESYLNK
jgi:hypothetical protein